MTEEREPIAVRFPLSGEWCPVTTPGHSIPSHGTDMLGQRYAYDFFQIDWHKPKGYKFYKSNTFRYLFFGVPLENTYCWSQAILSPFEGEVVEASDGFPERNLVNFFRDIFIVLRNVLTVLTLKPKDNSDLRSALGNYIILKNKEVYCLVAHTKKGSILVSPGDFVQEGQKIAEVGHSGNSTAPHLHFQLMDTANLLEAKGLPCCFKDYQSFISGEWKEIKNGIPGRRERISA